VGVFICVDYEFEEENRKLRQMYTDLALDNKMLKDILGKSSKAS
jgi:hypothetical protein